MGCWSHSGLLRPSTLSSPVLSNLPRLSSTSNSYQYYAPQLLSDKHTRRPVDRMVVPEDGNYFVVVGDCSGSGEQAGFFGMELIQSTGQYVGLPHEDPQRHIQNFLEITDTYNYPNVSKDYVRLTLFPFSLLGEAKEWLNKEPANSIRTWDDLARKFLIKFFPTKKTKMLRSQILGFEQRASETLCQAWERYKKLLRDCPHHCQTDEVLGHTFVDGLDDASKMNLDSACGGSCMAKPYSEIQLLLNTFTANDNNWQGDGDSRKAVKQKSAGLLELDEVSPMRAEIAKLANQMTRITMQQPQPMQQNQNQYRPQGGFNQPQRPPQQTEESTNDLLKKLLIDNQQLRTDFRNLERQMGQLATNKNTRPAGALPSDTEKNPQVNAVTLRNGRELEEVAKKKKDKSVREGELIPKVTNEPEKNAEIPEPVEAPRPPPPFPQRLQKQNDDRMFSKFLSMLSQVQLNIPLVDVLREIPKYAKYIKDIVAHKRRLTKFETVALTEECTSRVQNKLPQKLKDPGSFTIPAIGSGSSKANYCDVAAGWQIDSTP
ncbi:PREDICTED: uncharacterized protein LOC109229846 [Nicotiana attenuata]|uniref:uncharacterized protein LOC109229846 n=1 Tax=Nicotiana attenuata TaxID=49451 RepID=UPI0009054FBC|nr:PREDICTED: uncharacterized protein LOC109229846 [Nicotiana attenuata]